MASQISETDLGKPYSTFQYLRELERDFRQWSDGTRRNGFKLTESRVKSDTRKNVHRDV